jgi:hypothetical protein
MEKSGRNSAFVARRRLLIPALFALLCASRVTALEVDFFVSGYELTVGGTLKLEFSARNAMPADTSVDLGLIPSSFVPGSSSKERRLVDSGSLFGDRQTATVISQEWKLTEPGKYTLGPFTVKAKDDSVTLPPVYITVSARSVAEVDGLRWIVPSSGFRTGSPVRVILEAYYSGIVGTVFCPAPENALLEPRPFRPGSVSGSESGWSPVAVYDWTPLADGLVPLPQAILEITGANGIVRRVSSLPFSVSVSRSPVSGSLARPVLPASGVLTPAPAKPLPVQEKAGSSGKNAQRLRTLRQREYTNLFPGKFREERLALEHDLAFGSTLSVPPAAWKPFAVIGAVLCLIIGLLLRLVRSRSAFFRNVSRSLFFLSLVLVIFSVYLYTRDLKAAGVVTGGELLHIPEPNASVVESLKEGSPVTVIKKTDGWVYAESSSALRGWIPAGNVLIYTVTETSGEFRGHTGQVGQGDGKAVREKTTER